MGSVSRRPWGMALLAVLAAAAVTAGEPAAEIAWSSDVSEALQQARRSDRALMIDVWAVWCVPCKTMDETTYRDDEVVRSSSVFVPVKVDADVHEAFVRRYRVEVFPTVLFVDADGDEITRLRGLVDARAMAATMADVFGGYRDYLAAKGRSDDPEAVVSVATYLQSAGNPARAVELLRGALKIVEPDKADAVELRLAQALVQDGQARAAVKRFERLSTEAADREVRARALAGLGRAEGERGREDRRAEAIERLRRDYPDMADRILEIGGDGS